MVASDAPALTLTRPAGMPSMAEACSGIRISACAGAGLKLQKMRKVLPAPLRRKAKCSAGSKPGEERLQ